MASRPADLVSRCGVAVTKAVHLVAELLFQTCSGSVLTDAACLPKAVRGTAPTCNQGLGTARSPGPGLQMHLSLQGQGCGQWVWPVGVCGPGPQRAGLARMLLF